MESIHLSPLSSRSMDKLISSRGLLVSLDKNLNQLNVIPAVRFPLIPPTKEVVAASVRFPKLSLSAQVGSALMGFPKRPPSSSAQKMTKKILEEVAQFIWKNAEDLKKLVMNTADKKEEEPKAPPQPPAPSTPPAPLMPKRESWILQLLKRSLIVSRRLSSDFDHPYIVAGFVVVTLAILLFPKSAKVTVFSLGEAAQTFSKVSNSKRFGGIFFELDVFGSQMIDHFLEGPFVTINDDQETFAQLCTWFDDMIEGPFVFCFRSKESFSIAFRGINSILVGGAGESHLEGVVSPILLGSVDGGTLRYGTFISGINNMQFVILASATLLEVFTYQQIVDLVPPKGTTDTAERIVRAALEINPAIEELHAAVIYIA